MKQLYTDVGYISKTIYLRTWGTIVRKANNTPSPLTRSKIVQIVVLYYECNSYK